ncbi:MAG: undecaprenyldiphospho-muramoylpentapeptide beta-N-acetylglucosaminyltransferase [Tannerella sp.]|jgi:UDP-N-acetylglucosamine--N-acetylmuramyl-(pentapeptide) pyrophosphoryl-undecaprenol N-acetylglucosamine transferase|nr:undecaprenyldiphospho-muramoylpentapeptide beta-N-acetylglucosaminyltransferase [Tannerella sp.]
MKIIISGGGTGGHIFPALSIANEIRRQFPDADILFVGAKERMEMIRVPDAGYKIIGLPIRGLDRKNMFKNITIVYKIVKSLFMARKIIRDFNPDIAIGVGGYASGPTLWMASSLGVPVLIQEQNSYAGLTNKLLGKRAAKVCVAYSGMNRFFPEDKVVITGNPVRKELEKAQEKTSESLEYFGLEAGKPILLVLGGSLGARTINNGMINGLPELLKAGIQVIWQTGKYYYTGINEYIKSTVADTKNIWFSDFILRMDLAYGAADLIVSRAGAGTISELCLQKKSVVLVPSPNVAEDHQTKNALALSEHGAAVLLPDNIADKQLASTVLGIFSEKGQLDSLSEKIYHFAQYNSAERIVNEIINVINPKVE